MSVEIRPSHFLRESCRNQEKIAKYDERNCVFEFEHIESVSDMIWDCFVYLPSLEAMINQTHAADCLLYLLELFSTFHGQVQANVNNNYLEKQK